MSGLAELLPAGTALLLDFDGPICGVFSALSNYEAAERLVRLFDTPLPTEVSGTRDPFAVLEFATTLGTETVQRVERALARIEVEAVATCRPTPGAADVIRHAANRGYPLAIVSNNSTNAIAAYLDRHMLRSHIHGVFARTSDNLSKLKPNPYLLNLAISTLGTTAEHAVFVGDSTADIQAAQAADIASIAFANRPEKIDRFAQFGPDAVITSMGELVDTVASGQ